MNQQSSNRKPGPDNNTPPTGDDPQKKKSKFNIYWVYGLFVIGLIAIQLYRGVGSSGVETDQQKFYEMIKQGDVERIKTIRNTKKVRIFIYKDSLIKKPN
jgi:AFG3 family protein